jgi:plastocyanin
MGQRTNAGPFAFCRQTPEILSGLAPWPGLWAKPAPGPYFPRSRWGLPLRRCVDYRAAAMSVYRVLPLLAVLAVPASADAARVRGTVTNFRLLRNPVWEEAKDPKKHGYSFREPVPTVRAEFRRAFPHIPKELCVAALAVEAQKPPPPVLVRVGGGRTTPVTIVVPPGTRLTFQNTDPFRHRLYAVGVKTFAANDQAQGATREWTVPEKGTFEIRDEAAPSLRMWVVAEPNVAAIAYPSMKGEFSLSVEQPGEYTVQAYFSGKPVGPALPIKVDQADIDISRSPLKVADEKAAQAAEDKPEAKAGAEAK